MAFSTSVTRPPCDWTAAAEAIPEPIREPPPPPLPPEPGPSERPRAAEEEDEPSVERVVRVVPPAIGRPAIRFELGGRVRLAPPAVAAAAALLVEAANLDRLVIIVDVGAALEEAVTGRDNAAREVDAADADTDREPPDVVGRTVVDDDDDLEGPAADTVRFANVVLGPP